MPDDLYVCGEKKSEFGIIQFIIYIFLYFQLYILKMEKKAEIFNNPTENKRNNFRNNCMLITCDNYKQILFLWL